MDTKRLLAIVMLSVLPAQAHADQIGKLMKDIPSWKKFEKAARAREVVMGMPQTLFLMISQPWNCDEHITETGDDYHTQFVCVAAFSKKHELQGKYFYTTGKVDNVKGQKLYMGEITGIQNN